MNKRFIEIATPNNWKYVMTGGMTRTVSLVCKGILDWDTADMFLAPVKLHAVCVENGRVHVELTHRVFGGVYTVHCSVDEE